MGNFCRFGDRIILYCFRSVLHPAHSRGSSNVPVIVSCNQKCSRRSNSHFGLFLLFSFVFPWPVLQFPVLCYSVYLPSVFLCVLRVHIFKSLSMSCSLLLQTRVETFLKAPEPRTWYLGKLHKITWQ